MKRHELKILASNTNDIQFRYMDEQSTFPGFADLYSALDLSRWKRNEEVPPKAPEDDSNQDQTHTSILPVQAVNVHETPFQDELKEKDRASRRHKGEKKELVESRGPTAKQDDEAHQQHKTPCLAKAAIK